MRRPAKATVISLAALFFAVSGTAAGAATTGSLQLGQSNTAAAVTSLSNTTGSALSLSSTSTTPPLQVSNSVQVPNLNASLLGGHPATDFLTPSGTAADSSKLGGTPAGSFIQGSGQYGAGSGGTITDGKLFRWSYQPPATLISTPDSSVSVSATGDQCQLQLLGNRGGPPVTATWWNQDGTGQASNIDTTNGALLNGQDVGPGFTWFKVYLVVVQVWSSSHVSRYTLTEQGATDGSYQPTLGCEFSGQAVTINL